MKVYVLVEIHSSDDAWYEDEWDAGNIKTATYTFELRED